jgi:general secretion pathway protein L
MSKRYLGLEIGNHAVSGVVINSGIKGSAVEACARVALEGPQDLGRNLSGALERLATEMDITETICSVSLPPGSVSFRHIQLPFSDRKKIHQVLPYEIEPQLPYPVEDLVIDYYIMGPNRSDHSDLIAAAVQKATLEALLSVLTPLGIDPVTITSAGFATALCLADTDGQPTNWILADSDGVDLSLFFVEAGNLKLARATRLPSISKSRPAPDIFRQIHRSLLAFQDTASPDFAPETVFTNLTDLLESNHQPAEPVLAGLPLKKAELADWICPR